MPSDFAFVPIIPELILAIGALALVLIGVFGGERSTGLVTILSVVLLAAAGIAVVEIPDRYVASFSGAFTFDAFARLMKLLTLLGSAVAILMSVGHARAEKYDRFEFPLLIVIATLGMLLMISASDLIAVYLGLELQSLSLYVIAAINRDNVRWTEAGLKYFVLGALSSGMLLYGASLVYGFTGTVSFAGIAKVTNLATASGAGIGLIFG